MLVVIFSICCFILLSTVAATGIIKTNDIVATPYDPKYISSKNKSVLWKNPPQSQSYVTNNPKWYDLIETWAAGDGDKFISGDYLINVNMSIASFCCDAV